MNELRRRVMVGKGGGGDIVYPDTNGAYIHTVKGLFYTYSEYSTEKTAGRVSDSDVVSIVIISDDACFGVALENIGTQAIYNNDTKTCALTAMTSANAAQDLNGYTNTLAMLDAYGSNTDYATGAATAYTFKNGKHGYIPSIGELVAMYQYKDDFNSCASACGATRLVNAKWIKSSTYAGTVSSAISFWKFLLTDGTYKNSSAYLTYINDSCFVRPFYYIGYYPGRQGAFVYDTRGKFYTADEWSAGIADGSLDNDDVVGVAVISGEHRFVIAPQDGATWLPICPSRNYGIETLTPITDTDLAKQDFDGEANTDALIQQFGDSTSLIEGYAKSYTFKNGKSGYVPALGELVTAWNYKGQINACRSAIGLGDIYYNYVSSSTYYGHNDKGYYDIWGARWTDGYCGHQHYDRGGQLAHYIFCSLD